MVHEPLRTIDLEAAVREQWGAEARLIAEGEHAYDWRAHVHGEYRGLDLRRAVTSQYGEACDLMQVGLGKGDWRALNAQSLGPIVVPLLSSPPTSSRTSPLLIVSEVLAGRKLAFRTFYYMNFEQPQGSLFNLPRTTLSLEIRGNNAVVKNTGRVPAAGVNIQAPGRADKFVASDNFFWLDAGESAQVEVNITTELRADAWNLEGNEQVNVPH
jgi:hypothetical protein